jgi:hypothetical protein
MDITFVCSIPFANVNIASGQAGLIAQKAIIKGLSSANVINLKDIYTYSPYRVFPFSKKIIVPYSKRSEGEASFHNIPYINIPLLKWLSLNLSLLFLFLINGKRSDTVISYNMSYPSGWVPALLMKTRFIERYIPIMFDIDIPGVTVKRTLLTYFNFLSYKLLLKRMSKVICITKMIKDDFCGNVDTLIINGGLNSELIKFINSPGRMKVEPGNRKLKIGYAGGLEDFNGIRMIVDFFKHSPLAKKFEFHCAGSGSLVDLVSDQSDIGIKYYGLLTYEESLRLLDSSDILVCLRFTKSLNTKYVFPSKLIEYISLGKKMVVTDLPITDFNVYDLAEVIKEESLEALSIALSQSVENLAANTIIEEFIDYFNWDMQCNKIVEFVCE